MAHLSLAYATLFKTPSADVVTAAAAARFDSVGLRISGRKPGESYDGLLGNAPAIREVKRRLAGDGLRLSHISTYHLSSAITLADLAPVIDASAELGTAFIMINSTDVNEERRTAFIARYCEAAATAGLKLALEFVPFSEVKTIQQGYKLVKDAAQPNFGMVIDALHLARSGGKPADIAIVEPELIYSAQLCDVPLQKPDAMDLPTEARTNRYYPGEGELPLYDFLDAFSPSVEIDCEIPSQKHAGLPPNEQAKRAGDACRSFLQTYRQARTNARASTR